MIKILLIIVCLFITALYSKWSFLSKDSFRGRNLQSLIKSVQKNPNNAENLYSIYLIYAKRGKKAEALRFLKKAAKAGISLNRIYMDTRTFVPGFLKDPGLQIILKDMPNGMISGPMLGSVTDCTARFKIRAMPSVPVTLVLSTSKNLDSPIRKSDITVDPDDDLNALIEVKNLVPETRYYYDILLKGKSSFKSDYPSFMTFPPAGRKGKYKIAFGGGSKYYPPNEYVWTTVRKQQPLALLLLGDNWYGDVPDSPQAQRYYYYRRQFRTEFQDLVRTAPVYAIWDDHDFAWDNCEPGDDIQKPWKIEVWKIFKENWNNPYYGGGHKLPGCYHHFSLGDIDFFLVDTRYYRSMLKKSMLGPDQKKWLFKRLRESRATFKVLVSGVPFAFGASDWKDHWRGYPEEREEIFSFIEKNRINGIFMVAADRHRSDAWTIRRPGGHVFYEFQSSHLTHGRFHPVRKKKECLFGYDQKCSFGILNFNTAKADPEVTYRIISIDNEVIYELTLSLSQLTIK
jgi:alkaline phosphatase D